MNPRDYYERLIKELPTGADRSVLRVLSYHQGQAEAIQKPDLMAECAKLGTRLSDERQIRLVIVRLRKQGIPICSSSGDSGYFLAASMAEYQEFRGREYVKKIQDMRETVAAMDGRVRAMFPAEYAEYKRQQDLEAGQPQLL